MVDKQEIILRYFREGQSQRKIARDLGLSRPTVKKYIKAYRESKSKIECQGNNTSLEVKEDLISVPIYNSQNRNKRVLTNDLQLLIDEFILQNKQRRDSGLPKQVMKKIDILEAIQEKGHKIGYTTICNYIREKEQQQNEAFIKQTYLPGVECEFDWGEVKLCIGGTLIKVQLAVFTSCYSNYRYGFLFDRQDTLSFWQSHVNFFEHTGGVYHRMVYDNMRVVISRFVGKSRKEPTESLLKLSMYYGFDFRFCNVRKGNEKGHVERSVEYLRRKAFSRDIEFDTIGQANSHLLKICAKLNNLPLQGEETGTILELFEKEKQKLYSCPQASFECAIPERLKVDKYSTISYRTNKYSVPEEYVGKVIDVRIYAQRICIYAHNNKICEHHRSYGKHTWNIILSHYLHTLYTKPGALVGSLALEQACDLTKEIFTLYFKNDPKSFIELLQFARREKYSVLELHQAIEKLKTITPCDVNIDKIKVVCQNRDKESSLPVNESKNEIAEKCNRQLKELTNLFFN